MSKKQVLLINDIAGYGKVATAAMLPILSYMGHPTYNLPTALVSNTLDYGKFNILDTTDYMEGVFPVWKELGFRFDAIATGFIASTRQAKIVSTFCREQAANGTIIYVDPIMGDEGKLYNGVTKEAIHSMREMIGVADLIFPNYTEACYLTSTTYCADGVNETESKRLLDALHNMCGKSVLITSIPVDGHPSVVGYNHLDNGYFMLRYTEIPVHFPGTGDIFSAVLIGHLLEGDSLREATQVAMNAVFNLIDANKENADKNRGIPLENFLNTI